MTRIKITRNSGQQAVRLIGLLEEYQTPCTPTGYTLRGSPPSYDWSVIYLGITVCTCSVR